MEVSYIFLWIFVAASVLGTGALWFTVRAWARGDWKNQPRRKTKQEEEQEQFDNLQREQRQRLDQKDRSDSQRRRDDARAKCELLYTICAPEIGKRFSKQMLETFMKNYMGDNRTAEEVESRARQLEGILAEHREAVKPAPRFRNIEELAQWYVAEKRRIEGLPVDDVFKEQHLVELHMQYAEFTQQVMEQRQ